VAHDSPRTREGTAVKTDEEVQRPRMYKVLMHNDDYTTMDFVVEVLVSVFNMPKPRALVTMLSIHHGGVGMCGIYSAEIAETKIALVHDRARDEGFPLRCSMEPA